MTRTRGRVIAGLASPRITGDIDGDGRVGFSDLLILLGDWGPCDGTCPADLDGNGVVDFGDLIMLLANWTT